MTLRKRFIAGAVCPRCSAMDRVVILEDPSGAEPPRRACVACDFEEAMTPAGPLPPAPAGKHDQPKPAPQTAAQPLKFFPPPKRSS